MGVAAHKAVGLFGVGFRCEIVQGKDRRGLHVKSMRKRFFHAVRQPAAEGFHRDIGEGRGLRKEAFRSRIPAHDADTEGRTRVARGIDFGHKSRERLGLINNERHAPAVFTL